MATVTLRANGFSGGIPGNNGGKAGRTGGEQIVGWSKQSAQRNQKFLQSIRTDKLARNGVCYTLTVRQVPPDFADWQRRLDRLMTWLMRREGVQGTHWVTEWTKQGRPHLHGMVFGQFNPHDLAADIEEYWLDLTWDLGTQDRAQHCQPFRHGAAIQWLMYTAKHAARGAGHYQREKEMIPKGWTKTGRMWGKRGEWPVSSETWEMDDDDWFHFRRQMRRYAIAMARNELVRLRGQKGKRAAYHAKAAKRRIVALRSMLKAKDAATSRVAGIGGFADMEDTYGILCWASSRQWGSGRAMDSYPSEILRERRVEQTWPLRCGRSGSRGQGRK